MAKRRWKDVEIKEEYSPDTIGLLIGLFSGGLLMPFVPHDECRYRVTATDAETGRRVTGEGKTLEEAWKDLERKL
jgi:hypothetical protein